MKRKLSLRERDRQSDMMMIYGVLAIFIVLLFYAYIFFFYDYTKEVDIPNCKKYGGTWVKTYEGEMCKNPNKEFIYGEE